MQQLTAAAAAAVNEVVRRGVADPGRISVGGHSYGAFMAANLLAHAPQLFAAAVARSGAYNRTLTPFGFQVGKVKYISIGRRELIMRCSHRYFYNRVVVLLVTNSVYPARPHVTPVSACYQPTLFPTPQAEERTLWQAPETYLAMSPFMHAHVIKKPLLLVHGEEDNNTGEAAARRTGGCVFEGEAHEMLCVVCK